MADKKRILSIRDLKIKFDDHILFDGVNFDVNEDDFIVITTGILDGATTLLKSILGLVGAAEGQILFEGNDILQANDRHQRRRSRQKIGFVYEAGGLISITNVFKNLALPLAYHTTLTNDEIERKIERVATDLEMTDLLYLEPNELNDTQTRIVNLARALIVEPRLLLIDELEGGLTEERLAELISVIKRYQQREHFGVVITTLDKKSSFATAHYSIKDHQLEVDYVRNK
jgi:ABC-type transporter Mla maintaining outer membrane lipid asymmetry ATPase subunit MlaF